MNNSHSWIIISQVVPIKLIGSSSCTLVVSIFLSVAGCLSEVSRCLFVIVPPRNSVSTQRLLYKYPLIPLNDHIRTSKLENTSSCSPREGGAQWSVPLQYHHSSFENFFLWLFFHDTLYIYCFSKFCQLFLRIVEIKEGTTETLSV